MVSIIRDEIVQEETYARSAVVNKDGSKIGYIFLPEFYVDFETISNVCTDIDLNSSNSTLIFMHRGRIRR